MLETLEDQEEEEIISNTIKTLVKQLNTLEKKHEKAKEKYFNKYVKKPTKAQKIKMNKLTKRNNNFRAIYDFYCKT